MKKKSIFFKVFLLNLKQNYHYKAALINESLLTSPGCGKKAEVAFLMDCSASVGETQYKLGQYFLNDVIRELEVGADKVRISYVPFNSDVFECFGLDTFKTKDQVSEAICEYLNLMVF